MLVLYKRQKELLLKSLEIKRKKFDEVHARQKEIETIAHRMQVDRTQVESLVRLLCEHRNAVTSTPSYLDNLMLESEIKKKIMLVALNLASDPTVSHLVQRQRREFYERTKRKVLYLDMENMNISFQHTLKI